MTNEAFQSQMTRLVATFGKSHYSDERIRVFWKAVKDERGEWWADCVDHWIGHERQAPLMQQVQEALSREREKRSSQESREHSVTTWSPVWACNYCMDRGVYLARKNGMAALWGFRCHCSKGESDPRKFIPQFKQAHADDGFTFYEVGR
jgi:hypothetical protein